MSDRPTDDPVKKALERKARRTVAERVALYYHSLMDTLEVDAEGFFDRVTRLEEQRGGRGKGLTLGH